jgi:hypothetical protein
MILPREEVETPGGHSRTAVRQPVSEGGSINPAHPSAPHELDGRRVE